MIPIKIKIKIAKTLLKIACKLRDQCLRSDIIHILRTPTGARGMTASEITQKLPIQATKEMIEELLNQPLATGKVVGFAKRFCTVTKTMETVYWIKPTTINKDPRHAI